jgi:hypothetical protein
VSEDGLDAQIDQVIASIARELGEDKDVTDPTKKDYAGDVAMPHSNKGEGVQGTPAVGDAMKTGQTAKGVPTLAETGDKEGEAKAVASEDKDITDPTKKQFAGDVKMPHANTGEGPAKPQGGVVDPKATEMKPTDIGSGAKTAG